MATRKTITYEQPISEVMRTCLRLEQLFKQVKKTAGQQTEWKTRANINAVFLILEILERSDLKARIANMISKLTHHLERLQTLPEVDPKILNRTIKQLHRVSATLIAMNSNLTKTIRQQILPQQVHKSSTFVSFLCDAPALQYWFNLALPKRQKQIQAIMLIMAPIQVAVDLILKIVRDLPHTTHHIAPKGFYFDQINAQRDYQLIRIKVPASYKVYPECSLNKHRINICFYSADRKQLEADLPFELMLCNIQ